MTSSSKDLEGFILQMIFSKVHILRKGSNQSATRPTNSSKFHVGKIHS